MSGSVHFSGDGFKMSLRQVRQFVEATKDWPDDNWVDAGVVGKGLRVHYSTLQGLRAERRQPGRIEAALGLEEPA